VPGPEPGGERGRDGGPPAVAAVLRVHRDPAQHPDYGHLGLGGAGAAVGRARHQPTVGPHAVPVGDHGVAGPQHAVGEGHVEQFLGRGGVVDPAHLRLAGLRRRGRLAPPEVPVVVAGEAGRKLDPAGQVDPPDAGEHPTGVDQQFVQCGLIAEAVGEPAQRAVAPPQHAAISGAAFDGGRHRRGEADVGTAAGRLQHGGAPREPDHRANLVQGPRRLNPDATGITAASFDPPEETCSRSSPRCCSPSC
jgi:hypothetical protein